jgi:hypothetical protein
MRRICDYKSQSAHIFLLVLTEDTDFGEKYMTQYVLRRIFFVVPQYRHVLRDVYLWWHRLVQTICISMMSTQTSVTDQTRKWFVHSALLWCSERGIWRNSYRRFQASKPACRLYRRPPNAIFLGNVLSATERPPNYSTRHNLTKS